MTDTEKMQRFYDLALEKKRRDSQPFFKMFNEPGLMLENYPKHAEVIRATKTKREICFMAANRVGKSEMGSYIVTAFLTGRYPKNWEGVKFAHPVNVWAAGDTGVTTRDIIQDKLFGKDGDYGIGMIPSQDIVAKPSGKQGIPKAFDTARIRNQFGGESILQLKSYDSGRRTFQGTEQHVIWLDEECPLDVFEECVMRTMTTDGLIILTFTPLSGLTETVLRFIPGGDPVKAINEQHQDRSLIMATWDDAPHLTEAQKKSLWDACSPHQRAARSKGIPALGSGAIYPVPEEDFAVDPFEIPKYWPRCYGMDVGWNRTAATWLAGDPETGIWYQYAEHYRGEAEPSVHTAAIKGRGDWIPGTIDPASRGRAQKDGEQLLNSYTQLGLKLIKADNAVESGIFEVWTALSTGKLKIFKSCTNTLSEARIYRRDKKGAVVKQNDHAMDALRYAWMSGRDVATTKPIPRSHSASPARDRKLGY
jgi:phage terminase large subunit-like protein